MAKNTKKNNRWKIGKTELEISSLCQQLDKKDNHKNCEQT